MRAAWARNLPGVVSLNETILEELKTSRDEHADGDGLCIGKWIYDTKEEQAMNYKGKLTAMEKELERLALKEMGLPPKSDFNIAEAFE